MNGKNEVWGIAAGRGSTKDAAPGALTVREYKTESEARESIVRGDWRAVISSKVKGSSGM